MSKKLATHLTHESLYRGGEESLRRREGASVLLLGQGALGSSLTILLARQGYHSLTVVDYERVEEANFGTQAFGKGDLGRPKSAQSAGNVLRQIGVRVVGVNRKITAGTVKCLKGFDLVVDLFDNWESRELVRAYCEEKGIPCIHGGVAAMGFLQVAWNEGYKIGSSSRPDDKPCDYPLAANLVHLCVGAIAEVINRYIDDGKKVNVEMWLTSFVAEMTDIA